MQQIDLNTLAEAVRVLVGTVEQGEEVLLTRDGLPVARIVSEIPKASLDSELTISEQHRAREAMLGIRALRERLSLGEFDFEAFKRDRDEGRL